MATWDEQAPPELAPPNWMQTIGGTLRLGLMILTTLLAVTIFLIGRGLRAVLGRWVTFHFWVAKLWSRFGLWLAGLELKVTGTPIAKGSLVANHSSWLDILTLRSTRLIYFVSKAEVANWPGVGFITRITGTIFIERRRSQAKLQEALLRARMADNQLLCFFPEGTSTDGLRILPFKSSLFSAFYEDGSGTDILIQPVTVRYVLAQGSDLPATFYGWWGDMGFEASIWNVVTRSRGGKAEVIFHDPIRSADVPDRKRLAEICEHMVTVGMDTGAKAPPFLANQSGEVA
ncbi:MAG: lysophospholipid acyltransferase family protein [Pseudomonadota bacterium]